MSEKGLTFFAGNPFHNGHMALIETALTEVDELDIYVGIRAKPWVLPREVRIRALETAMELRSLSERVHILSTVNEVRGSILSIGPDPYKILAMGSDIANLFNLETKGFRDYERKHFLSFPAFTVLQRSGHELVEGARSAILEKVSRLSLYPAVTEVKGTLIRRQWKDGKDIRTYLPEGVWETIEPHVSVFKQQT